MDGGRPAAAGAGPGAFAAPAAGAAPNGTATVHAAAGQRPHLAVRFQLEDGASRAQPHAAHAHDTFLVVEDSDASGSEDGVEASSPSPSPSPSPRLPSPRSGSAGASGAVARRAGGGSPPAGAAPAAHRTTHVAPVGPGGYLDAEDSDSVQMGEASELRGSLRASMGGGLGVSSGYGIGAKPAAAAAAAPGSATGAALALLEALSAGRSSRELRGDDVQARPADAHSVFLCSFVSFASWACPILVDLRVLPLLNSSILTTFASALQRKYRRMKQRPLAPVYDFPPQCPMPSLRRC